MSKHAAAVLIAIKELLQAVVVVVVVVVDVSVQSTVSDQQRLYCQFDGQANAVALSVSEASVLSGTVNR